MKLPRNFFKPLAIGAPPPLRELPVRLERMIHFVPPHIEKVRAQGAGADRAGRRGARQSRGRHSGRRQGGGARAASSQMAKACDFGATGLWTRINALNSPWVLDDVTEIVGAVGDKLDVVMLPKVEGAWDIHYLDQLLAQLEAKHGVKKPILIHAILETAEGVNNVDAIATRLAAHARHQPRPGRSRRLARDEDDARRRRPSRNTRCWPMRPATRRRARAFQQDLWHYTIAKMVDACAAAGIKPFYGPFGDFSDRAACEAQFRNAFLMGCAGAWTLHPSQVADRQARVLARSGRSRVRQEDHRRHAGRHRRGHDRRQDAGRRHLEAGQGAGRSRPPGRRQGPGHGGRYGL